ncbi:MAG: IPTL-CTERM sorting domain-containing protein [Planctomycetes bacterium]|nr:IPTL-CTERM sorting domain-containing protein [Planctomycetota bacterium]
MNHDSWSAGTTRPFLEVILLVVASGAPVSGDAWITNQANGHQYKLTDQLYYGYDDDGPNPDQPDWLDAEAEAVAQCGHLVTINDQAENDWIVATFGTDRWIGFTDDGSEGSWHWISGEPVTYTNWQSGQPDNFGTPGNGEDSAHLRAGTPGGGAQWNDLGNPSSAGPAGLPWRGIIERGGAPWVTNPTNGHQYRLTTLLYYGYDDEGANPDQPDWQDAEAEAVSQCGHLVAINDQAENNWIVATFGTNRWIGFTDGGSEGSWRWVGGDTVTFTNWQSGQPDNVGTPGNGEDSAHLRGGTPGGGAQWNDLGNPSSAGPAGLPWAGIVERGPTCGDGACNGGETCCDCPEDCRGACVNSECVPTLSQWGVVAMTLLTLLAGTLALRKQRAATGCGH